MVTQLTMAESCRLSCITQYANATSRIHRDGGLAKTRSAIQLLRPMLPIRSHMRTTISNALLACLASVAGALALPAPLVAQAVSSRPASVSLTVVVPPSATSDGSVASQGVITLARVTATTIDFETTVALAR